jgi:penicillin-binding protein 2
MVGLAALAVGAVKLHEGIECTGFLYLEGNKQRNGRCWTESMFHQGWHHQIGGGDPHRGSYGNPDGSLVYADAIQRSCNVYFETMGYRLGIKRLSEWYQRFGLGMQTGIGIPEARGSLPTRAKGALDEKFSTVIAAIGQGPTLATPLQMANVAATIARDGIWLRPRLIPESYGVAPTSRPATVVQQDRIDLGLPKDAVAAAKEGMQRVVNTRAGSAWGIVTRTDLVIAGKTGTAETATRVRVPVCDASGKQVEGDDRKPKWRYLEPSTPEHPNPEAPWFRGWRGAPSEDGTPTVTFKHSWFIGFAPADHPRIAIAVAMEYGGSGGKGAGLIAKQIFESLIEHKYLERSATPPADAQPASASEPVVDTLRPVGD